MRGDWNLNGEIYLGAEIIIFLLAAIVFMAIILWLANENINRNKESGRGAFRRIKDSLKNFSIFSLILFPHKIFTFKQEKDSQKKKGSSGSVRSNRRGSERKKRSLHSTYSKT